MWYGIIYLETIWDISLLLSSISIVVMLILICTRYIYDKKLAAYMKRYKELESILFIHMENPLSELDTFIKTKYDMRILSELVQRVFRSFKGTNKKTIYTFIQDLKIEEWVCSTALKGNLHDRIAAIQLIGYFPSTIEHNKVLVKSIQNEEDFHVKYIAAESLAELGSTIVFPEVVRALQNIKDLSYLLIYDIFKKFGHDVSESLLLIINSEVNNDNIKIAAIMALGDIPTKENQQAIIKYCTSNNDELCAYTYYAIEKMALPIDDDVIISYGENHTYWKVRMYAADCAEHAIKLPITTLQKLLNDTNWMVSIHAAESLYSYGNAGIRILQMISQHKSIVGQRALSFLMEKEA